MKYHQWIEAKKELAVLYIQPIKERNIDPIILEDKIESIEKELIRMADEGILSFDKELSYKLVRNRLKNNQVAIEYLNFRYTNINSSDSVYYCALVNSPKFLNSSFMSSQRSTI